LRSRRRSNAAGEEEESGRNDGQTKRARTSSSRGKHRERKQSGGNEAAEGKREKRGQRRQNLLGRIAVEEDRMATKRRQVSSFRIASASGLPVAVGEFLARCCGIFLKNKSLYA